MGTSAWGEGRGGEVSECVLAGDGGGREMIERRMLTGGRREKGGDRRGG